MEQEHISLMLEDVRKAHRLIYQYQECVLSMMKEIREVYDFPKYPAARKHFSEALRNTETFNGSTSKAGNNYETYREANLLIRNKWAWDFLYTYEMEYYFGMKEKEGQSLILSVFQVTDNGYYMKDGYQIEQHEKRPRKTNPEAFWNPSDSKSYFIFTCEHSTNGKKEFFKQPKASIQVLYGKEEDTLFPCPKQGASTLIARRYPMEKCFDKNGLLTCLDDFAALVKKECGFDLKSK